MTAYRVVYAATFHEHVAAHVDYLIGEGTPPHVIADWYERLFTQIDALGDIPLRCPVDPFQTEATGRETRKMNFEDYLVFYQVDEDRRQVSVVAFMHGARRRTPD